MPRPPAQTLLQALLGTRVGEDALTDGLAYLLARDADLAREFACMLGEPDGEWRPVSACTQLRVHHGRVDLEVVLANGPVTLLVWVEAKTFTDDRDDQLTTYEGALEARRAQVRATDARIVTLAPFGNAIERAAHGHGFTHLWWQRILTAIVLIAECRHGPDWKESAVNVDAPAELRDLLDYSWRLVDRGVAVDVTPLDERDGHVAARAESLLDPRGVVGELLDVATHLEGFERLRDGDFSYPSGRLALSVGRTLSPTRPQPSWLLESGSPQVAVQLWFSTSDHLACQGLERSHGPGFLAGVVFGDAAGPAPLPPAVRAALTDPAWTAQLPSGIHVGVPDYEQIWLVGALPLSELGSLRELSDQMVRLRSWTAATIADVFGITRPDGWPSAKM